MDSQLDNPVWHSLCETHRNFWIDYGGVKFYHPDFCPFGAFYNSGKTSKPLEEYSNLVSDFFIIGDKPDFPRNLQLKRELICLQMVIHEKINTEISNAIVNLNEHYSNELFQLVTLVQPGYFRKRTPSLGNYSGIFNNGQLIAAAGERMQMNDFVEVSAIVTHPDHTGKGYAKQLIAHTVNNIFLQGKIPVLHVAEANTGAIALYEKLGFKTRRKISFWNFVKYNSSV